MADVLTYGRGEVYFAQFKPGTQIPLGERYLGNTPAFALTVDAQSLDHFNSDRGVKVKDRSVTTQVDYKGSMETDNIDQPNVALFFFGTADVLTTAALAGQTETFTGVSPGLFYQLGVSASRPVGVRKVTTVVVTVSGTAKTLGTDYLVDLDLGRVTPLVGGTIAEASEMVVTYAIAASTRNRVVSGGTPIEGALRFVSQNPEGDKKDVFVPWVKLRPNGDFALKGDDWLKIQFNIDIQRKAPLEAVYVDGRAL